MTGLGRMKIRHVLPLAVLLLSTPLAAQAVSAERLAETVQVLASDSFEGRAPGTRGEDRTIGYLIGRFQALGLEPGGPDGAWTQTVPLLRTQLGENGKFAVNVGGQTVPWTAGTDLYVSTLQPMDVALIASAPMVFVGYGVTAPERKWDDFKGIDLKGKVAVILVNDPDFAAAKAEPVSGKFGGRTMTYYGRWTYKFEEAARRGAVAALIVHETEGAGYGWSVVTAPRGENYDLVRAPDKVTSLALQGWLSGEAASALFAAAGQDFAKLRTAARLAKFRPVVLNATLDAAVPSKHEVVESHNILAKIPGTTHADETVLYGAHWDAYGRGAPDAAGHVFRVGANDDALGVAGLIEIARAFKAGPAPQRTIAFGIWTAEERGLLGSEAYATAPVYPLGKTVANLTLDILQTAGKARDVILVGQGKSTLEDDLAKFATAQGRSVSVESLPERGLFYRADHFSLAKRGVPPLLMMGIAGASDLVEGGKAAGQAWVEAYTGNCYHKACDRYGPDWNLAGAVEDVELMRAIGADLANSRRWPEWKPGSEFKALRDASAADRP